MYYVYVIRNNRTRDTYIGYTNNLERRIREHRYRNPDLLYYEAYKAAEDARGRERQLKQRGQAIRWLKNRLRHSLEK